jgi:hypothetical protein
MWTLSCKRRSSKYRSHGRQTCASELVISIVLVDFAGDSKTIVRYGNAYGIDNLAPVMFVINCGEEYSVGQHSPIAWPANL